MRNPLQRYYGRGDLHFITFSCYRRRPYLGTARARDRFVKILDKYASRYGFQLLGYVVMPEHVHLLLSEPKKRHAFECVAGAEAESFARAAATASETNSAQLSLRFGREDGSAGVLATPLLRFQRVEQRKSCGRNWNYMHRNPVQRKLVVASEGLAVEQLVALRKGRASE